MNGILLGRLYAMREQLDAIIETLEEPETKPTNGNCAHPIEKRKYAGDTMGNDAFTCEQCGEAVASIGKLVDRVVLKS